MATFASRLKDLREQSGWSQSELAQRGMNLFGIAKLEQGVRKPTWESVQALAKALGVDCTAFQTDPAGPAALPQKKSKGKKKA